MKLYEWGLWCFGWTYSPCISNSIKSKCKVSILLANTLVKNNLGFDISLLDIFVVHLSRFSSLQAHMICFWYPISKALKMEIISQINQMRLPLEEEQIHYYIHTYIQSCCIIKSNYQRNSTRGPIWILSLQQLYLCHGEFNATLLVYVHPYHST